jgi:hypothetical protein
MKRASLGVGAQLISRAAFLIVCLVVGLATSPNSAAAQEFRNTESIRTMFGMAYCAVRDDPADARKLFATPPGSPEEAKLIHSLAAERCLVVGMGLPSLDYDRQLLRGVIAEAVLDQSRKKGALDPAVAPFGNLSSNAIGALDAKGRASLSGLDFAQCVVAASPEGVKALLNTNPTWDEQDKAIEQLAPYLGPCLPKGAQISYSKLVLRGLLAEAAYRSFYFTTAAGKN